MAVFDLDETLVHCVTENVDKADVGITVNLNSTEQVRAGVNIRPYAVECLKELREHYELIVFTASHPNYANTVIDLLDPAREIFSTRLFRDSCIRTDINLFVKDLRVLGCDLKSTVIVDNSIFSFASQINNGVPVIPFYDDKDDRIMPKIKDYLISLKDLDDVRTINMKTFSLKELYDLEISNFLKYYYDDFEEVAETTGKNQRVAFDKSKVHSFAVASEPSSEFGINQRAQAIVDTQLVKFKSSLKEYWNNRRKAKLDNKKKGVNKESH